jgi:hypothetical protein
MLPGVAPGVNTCRDSLDEDQTDTMRETLGLAAAAPLVVQEKQKQRDPLALQAVLPPSDLTAIRRGDRGALVRFVRRLVD